MVAKKRIFTKNEKSHLGKFKRKKKVPKEIFQWNLSQSIENIYQFQFLK